MYGNKDGFIKALNQPNGKFKVARAKMSRGKGVKTSGLAEYPKQQKAGETSNQQNKGSWL